jgi:hypothetical protein
MTNQDTELIQHAIKATDVHRKIVLELWPYGVIARCPTCANTLHLEVEETIEGLATGWPKCCGHTMMIYEATAPK